MLTSLLMQNVRFTVEATIEKLDTSRPGTSRNALHVRKKINERFPHAQCKVSVSETNPNCRLARHLNTL